MSLSHYTRYRHLAIENAQSAPDANEIATLENALGASLPKSFMTYLQVANGGQHDYLLDIPVEQGKVDAICLGELFCTHNDGFLQEIIAEQNSYRKIPPGVLPFATDGSNYAYLDLRENAQGRIAVFLEALPVESKWSRHDHKNGFFEIAPSFDAYIDMLHSDLEAILELFSKEAPPLDTKQRQAWAQYLDIAYPEWRNDTILLTAYQQGTKRVDQLMNNL
ncbi:hypothetical protein CUZ56_02750 [Saezia sanguinis]|uniref:Knr4/Smi1-like domain-containing protein n=2 Tax=Saezia sanguinis TaxID=1965230 RepID=A0A433SAI0_9BURK|nr:hypothetical protein CUZ56_02750 [Saezia sanguinis]